MNMDRKSELIERTRALYKRAREQALTADDIVPLAEVAVDNHEDYIESIYNDIQEFDRHLAEFRSTYDIFRVFTAEQVVLDVGAHWGYSAVAMRHQGCKSRIVSIEAMPLNIPPLKRLKSIDGGLYDFYNVAASNTESVLRFYIPVINGWANTALSTTGGTLQDHYAYLPERMTEWHKALDGGVDRICLAIAEVPALPIDTIIDRAAGRLHPIAAMKMDIEGHEGPALQGARRLLNDQKPLLMVEGANNDAVVVAELTRHGYFHCERQNGRLVPHPDHTDQNDGFWLHTEKVPHYRELGILA